MPRLVHPLLSLVFATLMLLSACSKVDPVGADLVALNAGGQSAMASANVQQAMAKVQTAKTPAEKAAVLRESSLAIGQARAELAKVVIRSEAVRGIQDRMLAGFGKLGLGTQAAADAFDSNAPADMEKARQQMREGQVEFLSAGQEMVTLAKDRSVDLAKKP